MSGFFYDYNMTNKTLYLIPTSLGDNYETIPSYVRDVCLSLDIFIVENLRSARRYLRKIGYEKDFDSEVTFFELNKHTKEELEPIYNFLLESDSIGLLSEAGNPCIADPGSVVVDLCHQLKIQVKPLVGPSSILMALIASGFNGQQFTFHGYLPIDKNDRSKRLKELENVQRKTNYTQVFMETPYRNDKFLESIIKNCRQETKLCIAADISLETEFIETRTIANWQKDKPKLHKRPAIFILGN